MTKRPSQFPAPSESVKRHQSNPICSPNESELQSQRWDSLTIDFVFNSDSRFSQWSNLPDAEFTASQQSLLNWANGSSQDRELECEQRKQLESKTDLDALVDSAATVEQGTYCRSSLCFQWPMFSELSALLDVTQEAAQPAYNTCRTTPTCPWWYAETTRCGTNWTSNCSEKLSGTSGSYGCSFDQE